MMNSVGFNRNSGFTLVELMIAMTMSLIVLSSALGFFGLSSKASSDAIQMARVGYDMRSAMDLMVGDLRRAGYWSQSQNMMTSGATNPFTSGENDIVIGGATGESTSSCITYSWDFEADGVVHDGSGSEVSDRFGFRLKGGNLEMRRGGTGALNCDEGDWILVNDERSTVITGLSFSNAKNKCLNSNTSPVQDCSASTPISGDTLVRIRQIDIQVTSQSANDSDAVRTLANSVRVRNNKIETQP